MQAQNDQQPASSRGPAAMGFSFQEDLWFGDFDDDAAREAAASSMAAMAGRVMGARPFPAAAQRLVQLTRNPDANIHKVVRVLESDPGLSQRVLRLVNSAGYGLRVRCTSLNHATALLGQNRLQQIATSAVLLNHFGRTSDETKRKQEHGALVASLCRYLAIHLGLPQEDLFTCGLLHDLGQLMMLDDGDKEYVDLVHAHEGQWDSLHISEREILGFDHAVLAAHVLASWSIPAPVPEVIALHHQPALAHQRGAKISAMVQTLRFADHMSHLLDGKGAPEGAKELADSEAASYLGFSEMQIGAMWKDLRSLRDANRSRRMDIADIAPRSVEVPPSLTPREHAITDAPMPYSQRPASGTEPAPTYSDAPLAADSLPPDSLPLSGGLRPLGEETVIKLDQATPIAHVDSMSAHPKPTDEPAPALPDENESLEEEDRSSLTVAEPEVFPCAICYGPTFGARCPVCIAHVCSAHQTTERQWCIACEAEFGRYTTEHKVNRIIRIATATAISVAFLSGGLLFGWSTGFGVLGVCLTGALATYAVYQGYLKAQFKKDRSPVDEAPMTLATPHRHRETLAGIRLSEAEERQAAAALDAIPGPELSGGQDPLELEPTASVPSPVISSTNNATDPNLHKPQTPLISAHPISRAALDLASLPPMSEGAVQKNLPAGQETIPAPSVARARERQARDLEDTSWRSDAAWPPSQEPPGSSRRTSFLPKADAEQRNHQIQASEPPRRLVDDAPGSSQTEDFLEQQNGPTSDRYEEKVDAQPHARAIAPPSMNEDKGDELDLSKQVRVSDETGFRESEPTDSGAPTDSHQENGLSPALAQGIAANIAFSEPQCEPAQLHASITPPLLHQHSDACTAPSGTVKILNFEQDLGDAPLPGNDQSQRTAGEN